MIRFREERIRALQRALNEEIGGFRIDHEVAEKVIAKLDVATLAARISIADRQRMETSGEGPTPCDRSDNEWSS
ncbi:hypothetical protein H0X91_33365 [Burkholderia sp. 9777_1386]|uniref:hypothetical protein n=1 Tax=Burkholderia sp. 9777_1386 TaxID=2751183 RepID=UPI0018C39E2C|nr:hypothetical protein [Burkholderia sp. 9777_1386]MBG0874878.1 hypothetical protein [Burkholderia sp. 9777_1386]